MSESSCLSNTFEGIQVIKRTGQRVAFDANKIRAAIAKAFSAVAGENADRSERIRDTIHQLTSEITQSLLEKYQPKGELLDIETIQNAVELALMRVGEHQVAHAYVVYRDKRRQLREAQFASQKAPSLHMQLANGELVLLDFEQVARQIQSACQGLPTVNPELILKHFKQNLYDKIPEAAIDKALTISIRPLVEQDPAYSFVAARFLLYTLYQGAHRFLQLPFIPPSPNYAQYFPAYIQRGIELELLDPRLHTFNLQTLAQTLQPERDQQLNYLGLQTLYDRYFIHHADVRFELPQTFFMRIAMGLALRETDRTARAIEFYHLLSSFDYMASTPTLFNAGTLRPQLSSCFLTTIPDNLEGIYSAIKDNALLSKFAGGLGNDWTAVRAMGAVIKGTNGKSQGVVPFLNVANASTVAVNQGGKRKGAVCAYLETWHLDIEEFLELRKNTGDDRRRTHDMHTAHWIPDLFMKRVIHNEQWTLFSPDETPDLQDLYGKVFETRYQAYEAQAAQGNLKNFKQLSAVTLWRKMLSLLFETGHPWITFKDPCNLRSPQQHVGIVHSSNLCTEITLNTSLDEIAVCNLGSVNLARHLTSAGEFDQEKLKKTIRSAMRMLDNVIDINYYTVPQAKQANLKHRPVGLGIMGFQDVLFKKRLPFSSPEALELSDQIMEWVSYYAIDTSSDLAKERGKYASFEGSLWSQGILPPHSIEPLAQARGKQYLDQDRRMTLDWETLRQKVLREGMRNSNCLAIAPTATISNICNVTPSIEPIYQNLFVKSNMSGEFTIINPYLVADLKQLGLWDTVMLSDLKYYNGSIQKIARIPTELKVLYATVFEIDPRHLVEAASRRQKWLDQSQSLNLFVAQPSGKKLDELYKLAWLKGLKTTYYLRTLGATHTEKATVGHSRLNIVSPVAPTAMSNQTTTPTQACTEEICEVCQ
jgi:ribonucleoside-diphosphate reductase alpha chain